MSVSASTVHLPRVPGVDGVTCVGTDDVTALGIDDVMGVDDGRCDDWCVRFWVDSHRAFLCGVSAVSGGSGGSAGTGPHSAGQRPRLHGQIKLKV